MRTLSQHLIHYAHYHRDPRNIHTHFVGIPLIVLAVASLLAQLPLPGGGRKADLATLAKIDAYARGIPMPTADEHPATAQMMIMNPLSGGGLAGLFSTHPATEERVARLRAMVGS